MISTNHSNKSIDNTVLINQVCRRGDTFIIFILFTITAAIFVFGPNVLGSWSDLIRRQSLDDGQAGALG